MMPAQKIRVALLFGGKSAEHEVSLESARNVLAAIDRHKYEPVLIGIDKTGKWLLGDGREALAGGDGPRQIGVDRSRDLVTFAPESNGELSAIADLQNRGTIDVAFPILHGPLGEDGTVQGLLKLANIPFVGASVLGSAVGMDKDVMKRLLRDAGIPLGKFLTLTLGPGPRPGFDEVVALVGRPFFVKPANMGSSVGVSKVADEAGYREALDLAFSFDRKVLVEEFIEGREIECSVLGNDDPVASVVGEVKPSHDFYTYEAKYLDEHGARLDIPADLPPGVADRARSLAVQTFRVLCCEGLGRVDMFLRPSGEVLVNEINTIPGFTKISMYPKLWEASGVSYTDLIDRLIQLALERFAREKQLRTSYR